jgi:pyridoxal phosphate enzyme (YggS family)
VAVTFSVAEHLAEVHARIDAACRRAGRASDSVQLVAVSKFHDAHAIREAYAAGQRVFGESYAQELAHKAQALRDLPDLRLRFIGGFQTNKAKLLVPTGCSIDSLASEAAAKAVDARAQALGRVIEVMIQVNVVGETQKSGIAPDAVAELVAGIRRMAGLRLTGLMAIPPADDPARARVCFQRLRELSEEHGLEQLSMGMSDDLELAIEEGSTMVRVGTAIFGERPVKS